MQSYMGSNLGVCWVLFSLSAFRNSEQLRWRAHTHTHTHTHTQSFTGLQYQTTKPSPSRTAENYEGFPISRVFPLPPKSLDECQMMHYLLFFLILSSNMYSFTKLIFCTCPSKLYPFSKSPLDYEVHEGRECVYVQCWCSRVSQEPHTWWWWWWWWWRW